MIQFKHNKTHNQESEEKLVSLGLVVIMTLSFATTAFAQGEVPIEHSMVIKPLNKWRHNMAQPITYLKIKLYKQEAYGT